MARNKRLKDLDGYQLEQLAKAVDYQVDREYAKLAERELKFGDGMLALTAITDTARAIKRLEELDSVVAEFCNKYSFKKAWYEKLWDFLNVSRYFWN